MAGSNQSTLSTDKVSGAPTVATTAGAYSIVAWYKPANDVAGGNPDVVSWGDALGGGSSVVSARGYIRGNTPLVNGFYQTLTDGTTAFIEYDTAIPAATWAHLVSRWGEVEKTGDVRAELELFLNGELDASAAVATSAAASNSRVDIWKSPYSTGSALGKLCRVAVFNYALTNAEVLYLAKGGNPRSLRPSSRTTGLVEYIDFETSIDILDRSGNNVPQTVTGTVHSTDAPIGLLPDAKDMGRNGNIYATMFRGDDAHSKHDMQMYLGECTDQTGTNFEFRPCYCINQPNHKVRDTDFIDDRATTGKWWMGCINEVLSEGSTGNGFGSDWGLYSSDNGVEWTFVQNVDCSAITGVFNASTNRCRTWSPRFFVDSDGTLRVYCCLSAGNDTAIYKIYEMHPQSRTNLSGAWSTPVELTGSNFPVEVDTGKAAMQGPQMHKSGSTYYLVFVHWKQFTPQRMYVAIASSTSPTSGFTVIKGETGAGSSLDWAGFGSSGSVAFEGPSLMQRHDGRWIMYLDQVGNAANFSISSIAGTLPEILASATWSLANDVLRIHGTYAIPPNFVPQGFMAHRAPGAAADLTLQTGLTSLWTLNGNSLDSIGANNLINNGSTAYTTGLVYPQAANLVAASHNEFSIATNSSFAVGFNSWCVGGFVRLASKTANMGLFTRDDYSDAAKRIWNLYYKQSDDTFVAEKFDGDGGNKTISPVFNPTTGVDYLVILSFDYVTDEFTLWIRGGVGAAASGVSATAIAGGLEDGTAPFRVGGFTASNVGADWWNGRIGPVFYYNRALFTAEKNAIFNAGAGVDLLLPGRRQSQIRPMSLGLGLGIYG